MAAKVKMTGLVCTAFLIWYGCSGLLAVVGNLHYYWVDNLGKLLSINNSPAGFRSSIQLPLHSDYSMS